MWNSALPKYLLCSLLGSAQQGLLRGAQLHRRRNEIWEMNDVTVPGTSQMDVLGAVMCWCFAFPELSPHHIQELRPQQQAGMARWTLIAQTQDYSL